MQVWSVALATENSQPKRGVPPGRNQQPTRKNSVAGRAAGKGGVSTLHPAPDLL